MAATQTPTAEEQRDALSLINSSIEEARQTLRITYRTPGDQSASTLRILQHARRHEIHVGRNRLTLLNLITTAIHRHEKHIALNL